MNTLVVYLQTQLKFLKIMPLTVVLGASENSNRTSFTAVKMLAAKGHDIIAIGNKEGKIGEIPITTKWPENINIDTITLYINPEIQSSMESTILHAGPRRIIFNPGTENLILEKKANEKGIETIQACTLVLLSLNQY